MTGTSRRRVLSTGAAALSAIAGCLGGGDGDGGDGSGDGGATPTVATDPTVDMTDGNVYDPETIRVEAGTTVTWENVGSVEHSVTAYADAIPEGADYWASGGFEDEAAARDAYPEGAIGGGGTYEYTFETTGTHDYFCIPHERVGMKGTVEVV